jgi:hypothetical protein
MSKDIVCARAEAAEPGITLKLSPAKTICNNLLERMKGKLNTKNPYLLTYISTAIYRLEYCDKEFDHFMGYTTDLSTNATKVLQEESNQLLHAIRRLEYLIRPFEHDWVVVTQDVRDQCEAVLTTLFLVALDIWLIREIQRRTYSLMSVLSNSAKEQYSDVQQRLSLG